MAGKETNDTSFEIPMPKLQGDGKPRTLQYHGYFMCNV